MRRPPSVIDRSGDDLVVAWTLAERKRLKCRQVIVARQTDLLEVVGALGAPRCLACRLHGGKQQGNENRDDGDDHKQFDQREAGTSRTHVASFPIEKK